MSLRVLVDTREKLPYDFKAYGATIERSGLPCGDYSLAGYDDAIALERKSLDDLIGCMLSGRKRFERELSKARSFMCFAVIVEASFESLATGQYRSAMLPHAAVQSILAMQVKYRVPFIFAGNRAAAEYITFSLLEKFARNIAGAAQELAIMQPDLDCTGRGRDLFPPRSSNNFACGG